MKKIILFALCLLISASLIACDNGIQAEMPKTDTEYTGDEEYSDLPGLKVSIASIENDESVSSLEISWINESEFDISYGDIFFIERYEEGEWVSCSGDYEIAFNCIAYTLSAGCTHRKIYTLTKLYDVSDYGTYRFRSHCTYIKDGKAGSCDVWTVFKLSESSPDHTHQLAETAQTIDDPFVGYCGNTQTTIYIGEKSYTFMYGNSVTLTDILLNLDYDKAKLCKCLPEYTVDTEFETGYGINLTEGYARSEKGQADLTSDQVETIKRIIEEEQSWLKRNQSY